MKNTRSVKFKVKAKKRMMDKYRREIRLNGLPKTPNSRMHWAIRAKENKKWREASKAECLRGALPLSPLTRVRLTLIRCSTKQPDLDNNIASFKAIIDGLKDAKIINDDNPNVVKELIPKWEKVPPKAGRVVVIVEEL